MNPSRVWNLQAFLILLFVLVMPVLTLAQTVPAPSAGTGGPFPNLPRPQGAAIGPPTSSPCGQNRLTVPEQLQTGATLSEILQQENRAVACKVNPAVVEVIASGFGAIPGQVFDTAASATPGPTIGSGVIVSNDGFIVTNRHVITNAPKLTVVLNANGRQDEQIPASLVGEDETSDLAVLKIERTGLPLLEFNLQPVRQGDTVFAFGSPHGIGNAMTKGIISAPVRQVREEDEVDYIQTDAVINPGNSGGALVDMTGRLVGINTFILSGSGGNEGINFALPAGVVARVYDQIRMNGYVIRGTIGITTRNLTPELIRALNLKVQDGVYIEDVEPQGPADLAGIQVGDIVVAYEDTPLKTDERRPDPAYDLRRAITARIRGAKIQLAILRGSERKTFDVVVKQSLPKRSGDTPQLSSDFLIESLGIYGLKMTFGMAAARGLRNRQGIVVSSKVQSMQGDTWDLQVDDLITQVNGAPVTDLDELRQAMDNAESGSTVFINVERNRKMTLVRIDVK